MSDTQRSIDEYLERYAKVYCNGDVEKAKKHAIVREVMREKAGEQNE